MSLSNTEKKQFRSIGHSLKPVVIIAQNGLSENVSQEIDRALKDHELIKVKIQVPDRESKQELIREVCSTLKAECVQTIGHIALLYRAAKKPDPRLSNLKRKQL
ncbi:MAG: ribosome assembly RNA-binding protein YhbY [Pseudomonadales bacterium]|nr:ribosome assembly RNA-binding protein YhbY [Pseudomonadales bacterium]